MRFFVLIGVALMAFAEVHGMYNYHKNIGIPEAMRIKAQEDGIMTRVFKSSGDSAKIVGGAPAPSYSYPYLAGLLVSFINTSGQSACGSTLISTSRLVTAAHCWSDGVSQAQQFEVVLGSEYLFYYGTRVTTSEVVLHPEFNPVMVSNDVAVIYLPYAVKVTDAIQPVYLPNPSQLSDSFNNEWAYAAGYGKTSDLEVGVSTDTVARHVNLRVISNEECAQTFTVYVQPSTLCTSGAGSVGVCGGDLGGPLVVKQGGRDVLIGITSFVASEQCHMGYPSGFARVTSFYPFITSNL